MIERKLTNLETKLILSPHVLSELCLQLLYKIKLDTIFQTKHLKVNCNWFTMPSGG
jgi:hypothetical protein